MPGDLTALRADIGYWLANREREIESPSTHTPLMGAAYHLLTDALAALDAAGERERAEIVAWLRKNGVGWVSPIGPLHGAGMTSGVTWAANAIERGDHHPPADAGTEPAPAEPGKPAPSGEEGR